MPDDEHMTDDLDLRRRRALYRARHRGTKEMDWLLGRFADGTIAQMDARDLVEFERLLDLPDDELQHWIMGPMEIAQGAHAGLLKAVRKFHGL